MKKLNFKMLLLIGLCLSLSACGKSKSKSQPASKPPVTHNDPTQCQNQVVKTGIKGNAACPYQGAYDSQLGYQKYGIYMQASYNFNFNISLKSASVDYDWEYNELCPIHGQIPVFINGSFSECRQVNPTYAVNNHPDYRTPPIGECAGTQYNPEITGCTPRLTPGR